MALKYFDSTRLIIICQILTIAVMLSSCANYRGIQSQKKIAQTSRFQFHKSLPKQHGKWPSMDWAKQFGDSQLELLIKEALANNPSLHAAKARIEQARSIAQSKSAALSPHIKWAGEGGPGQFSTNINFPSPFNPSSFTQGAFLFTLNYSLDFWGKNLSNLKLAIAKENAAKAAEQESRLSIATAVASTYNQLSHYYALREVMNRTIIQQEALHKIAIARLRIGLDTKVQVYNSLNMISTVRRQRLDLDSQIRLSRQQLGVLLGAGPDRGLTIKRPRLKKAEAPALPDDLPLNLLGRRPDIVGARWQVEATCQGIKHVKALFYPNVNLVAGGGLLTAGLNHFLLNANAEYIGPAVSLPIFDGGALRAKLREQYAYYEEAVANYDATLNRAFADVAQQLTAIQSVDAQLLTQIEALHAAKRAYHLAKHQYRIGLISQLVMLNTETRYLDEQQTRLQLIMNRRNLQIALIKSLGGGFNK